MDKFFEEYTNEFIDVLTSIDKSKLRTLYELIQDTKRKNSKIFILGNGGSSASASHWVCDFNKGTNFEGSERLQVYSLSDNIPTFSAIGNDMIYEDVFIEQLKNYLAPDDLVIGLSVSGNSQNIVKALNYSSEINVVSFSIVGDFDGEIIEVSNDSLIVPSKNYGIVEDIHMYVCHMLTQYMHKENIAMN